MSSPYPAAEPVENAAGGSTDWGAMTPGQRVTFLNYAAERGFAPCDGPADVYSSIPPAMCPSSATAQILTSSSPANAAPGLVGKNALELPREFWLGLIGVLLVGAVALYLVGDQVKARHPVLARL